MHGKDIQVLDKKEDSEEESGVHSIPLAFKELQKVVIAHDDHGLSGQRETEGEEVDGKNFKDVFEVNEDEDEANK